MSGVVLDHGIFHDMEAGKQRLSSLDKFKGSRWSSLARPNALNAVLDRILL